MEEEGPDEDEFFGPVHERGPFSWRNWRASDAGHRRYGVSETPLYTSARVTGEASEGLGPYRLMWAAPYSTDDPALILVAGDHLDPSDMRPELRTNTTGYTGLQRTDEIAALLALALGVWVAAGGSTRDLDETPDGPRWRYSGDSARPRRYAPPLHTGLPLARQRVLIQPLEVNVTEATKPGLLSGFPTLSPDAATALVRSARMYRDAVWIAEQEPQLCWLLLVCALETAAVYENVTLSSPTDILRKAKRKLYNRLKQCTPPMHEFAAKELSRLLDSQARFVALVRRFLPSPPASRPPVEWQIDWSEPSLVSIMLKIYEHRSAALHNGTAFPATMASAPMRFGDWQAPAERLPGLAVQTLGGVWNKSAVPMQLHTFEYLTRGVLLRWWTELVNRSQAS
jgi:hypothetical protein